MNAVHAPRAHAPLLRVALDPGPSQRPFPLAGFSVPVSPPAPAPAAPRPEPVESPTHAEYLGLAVAALWLLAALLA